MNFRRLLERNHSYTNSCKVTTNHSSINTGIKITTTMTGYTEGGKYT